MIQIKADAAIKAAFNKAISVMGADVEWCEIFVINNNSKCSFSSAKISNIPVTSKYLAGYFILFSIKTRIARHCYVAPALIKPHV